MDDLRKFLRDRHRDEIQVARARLREVKDSTFPIRYGMWADAEQRQAAENSVRTARAQLHQAMENQTRALRLLLSPSVPDQVLRAAATEYYSEHPDYDPSWRD